MVVSYNIIENGSGMNYTPELIVTGSILYRSIDTLDDAIFFWKMRINAAMTNSMFPQNHLKFTTDISAANIGLYNGFP